MKTLKMIAASLAVMLIGISATFAQDAQTAGTQKKSLDAQAVAAPGKFVDANNDGICDNHQTGMKCAKSGNSTCKGGEGTCCNKAGCCEKSGGKKCGKNQKNCNGEGNGNCSKSGCGYQGGQGCRNQNSLVKEPVKTTGNQ